MKLLKKYKGIAIGDNVTFVPTNEKVTIGSIRKHTSGSVVFIFPTPPEFKKQYREKNGTDYFMLYAANRTELNQIYR